MEINEGRPGFILRSAFSLMRAGPGRFSVENIVLGPAVPATLRLCDVGLTDRETAERVREGARGV